MVNFICHLDWTKGYPDSWQNIIPGYYWRAFQEAFELVGYVKKIVLYNAGRHHPICWEPEQNQKAEEGQICLSWDIHLPVCRHQPAWFLDIWTRTKIFHHYLPDSTAFGLRYAPSSPLVLMSLNLDWFFLVFQLTDSTLWDFPASMIAWPNFYN